MSRTTTLILGTLAMVVMITGAAALSAWPTYRSLHEDMALLKLSFSHGGARNCRQMTEDELDKLPPNMRRKEICDRRRLPVLVVLEVDGAMAFRAELPPSGLSGDGPSRVYETFTLPAGLHSIGVRLRDSDRADGFDYTAERQVDLVPGQNFVVDFSPVSGGFVFN